MDIKIKQQVIEEEFNSLDSWEQKYQYLIEKGRTLTGLGKEQQVEENRIKGCQSQVWLVMKQEPNSNTGILKISAYSDAAIVRGLIALLLEVFDNQTAESILAAKLDFLVNIGLIEHLSPNRKNGLGAMIKEIYARANKQLVESNK